MFEKFTSADAGDFRQRYQGTFGYFTYKGKRTLTRLDRINSDGRSSYVEFSDREGLKYLLHPDAEDDNTGFEFLPPKSSYYNTTDGVPLLVGRVPARQYLRGICDKNTSVTDLNSNVYGVDFDTLVKLFETNIAKPVDALSLGLISKNEARGVAISPQFAVGFATGVLKCFSQPIGMADYDNGVFKVKLDSMELWGQEIKDAFARANLKVEFK